MKLFIEFSIAILENVCNHLIQKRVIGNCITMKITIVFSKPDKRKKYEYDNMIPY
jgi:hypothetical protein